MPEDPVGLPLGRINGPVAGAGERVTSLTFYESCLWHRFDGAETVVSLQAVPLHADGGRRSCVCGSVRMHCFREVETPRGCELLLTFHGDWSPG